MPKTRSKMGQLSRSKHAEVAWAAPLGSLWHACCRACGWMYTIDSEEVSDERADCA